MEKLKLEDLNRVDVEEFKQQDKAPIVLVLDNVRSMHNVGAIFRTADAFAIQEIILCGITAQPPHREIEKAALGATKSVDWKYFSTTKMAVESLKTVNYCVLAVEQAKESISLHDFIPKANKKYALIFGNEVEGVDEDIMTMVDGCLEIPQFGTKHSLNIATTAGIVVWDLVSKTILTQ